MANEWSWVALGWFFGSIEAFLAIVLLLLSSVLLARRLRSKLFATAAVGFVISLVGSIFRFIMLLNLDNDALCGSPSVSKMGEFIECTNQLAGWGTAISAFGLLLAGVCVLALAIRTPQRSEA